MTSAVGSPRARALSAALRGAREGSGWSARRLADRLSLDQSHLSRIENGKRVPSLETTAMILASLRTEPAERERILDLARNANEPNWLAVGMPGIPQQLAGAMESERAASAIYEWSPMVVPGLLQTADYVRAVARADGVRADEIESRVAVRLNRREVLERPEPAQFELLVGEAALRQLIGAPDVRVEQLRHLIAVSANRNVRLRVVPIRVPWHPGTAGPFILYEFADSRSFVHFEHYSSGAFVTDAGDVAAYHQAVNLIAKCALSPSDSVEIIADAIVKESDQNG